MTTMNYQLLGRSGLRISDLCLGTMTFGDDWGWGAAKDQARKIYDAFREAGGNFIDTANIYTNGSSEKILADLIAPERDRWVLATKYSLAMSEHGAIGRQIEGHPACPVRHDEEMRICHRIVAPHQVLV